MSPVRANWNYPTTIRFGIGRIAELAEASAAAGIHRPLLVTDSGLAKLPMVEAALGRLRGAGLAPGLFAGVKPNPTEENVLDGVAAYRAGDHDGVIAMGGGSGLDVGKLVALMVGQTRSIFDFEDVGDWWTRANADAIPPIVAVPTTAGTGSEVGRAGVVTGPDGQTKKIIFHPRLMPKIVIADPELTAGLPRYITAATGMDALAHCLEAYCAPGFHPMADGIAVEGLRLIRRHLAAACRDGRDLDARGAMMAAASMGAAAFQKGLGAVHSISHPLGARYDAHHGLLNGILMPYVLAFNAPAVAERMGPLAGYLELPGRGVEAVLGWLLALRREIGIPHTLAEIGIDAAEAEEIGRIALTDPSTGGNPVPVTAQDLQRIFENAVAGVLDTVESR